MNNNLIKLETYPQEKFDNDYFQDNYLTVFKISKNNLYELLNANYGEWENLNVVEDFLKTYIWDDVVNIYEEAKEKGYIEHEKIIKRKSIKTYIKSV